MTHHNNTLQNLKDAGCGDDFIENFFKKSDDIKSQLCMLSKHRTILLRYLHKYQKELDCLDFLVYSIKKNLNNKGKESDT